MSVYISVLWGLYFKFYKGMQNLYGVLCAFFNAITPMCRSPPRNFDFNSRFLGGLIMYKKPKRVKKKDNPYTIKKEENNFIICFKDTLGKLQEVNVTEEIYVEFDKFELDDKKEMNEFDRHIEHFKTYEELLEQRAKYKTISMEDDYIQKSSFKELKKAINKLPEPQRRRIKKYYFEDKNEYQIAEEENTTHQAISQSLKIGRENLKNFLNFF